MHGLLDSDSIYIRDPDNILVALTTVIELRSPQHGVSQQQKLQRALHR